MEDRSQRVSIVIPVHNEGENLLSLLEELEGVVLDQGIMEALVVDDKSEDESLPLLRELKRKLSWLRVIFHLKRGGQSMALLTGIRHARGDVIVTMDGDGQNDPEDIRRLLGVFFQNSSDFLLVMGRRRRRRDSWIKRVSSRIANGVRGYILKDNTPDTGCGLKVFKKGDFLRLPTFDHMHRFLPALFLAMGGKVISVDVSHRPRAKGLSHYGTLDRLWMGIWDLFGVYWLIRRTKKIEAGEIE